MEVSTLSAVPKSIAMMFAKPSASSPGAPARTDQSMGSGLSKKIDFSHVTPRQLEAYINERIFSNTIEPDDVTGIMNQLGATQMDDAPDVPFNLRAQLNGCRQYSEQTGSPLAAWYAHLGKQLDIMQAQSVHLSVVA
ncbi:hypothetical protein [Luteibacter yeojuensis]|uniref:Uncharacterized protein n=1 Tax=Luteibacter yeojuensis TaxID=345309 RepID=A0A0F3KHJ9_9GAMM|nr:hypothetical protein [Luteibacter yeojuensis]KJV30730.1 hypothetical protein VI08_14670 [Luteibacter yeojuensis]